MEPPPVSAEDARHLFAGQPPRSPELLEYLGLDRWTEFLRAEYLDGYLADGGTKVKLLLGTAGSGKSHQLALAAKAARDAGYLTAEIDARGDGRLFPMDRFFAAIVRSIDLSALIQRLCDPIVQSVGYQPDEIPPGSRFLDWAEQERGVVRAELERRVRESLGRIIRTPGLDLTLGVAIGHLAADHLGLSQLNEVEEDALKRWFQAEKTGVAVLRGLRLYKRVDRHTARALLLSLVTLAVQAGYRGLVVCVDNLEVLLERDSATGRQLYTRTVRDESYEAIRELIDEIDEAHGTLFLFAGRRSLLDDEKAGVSSYEALRLRLLPEVRGLRFNPYADVVDMDAALALGYLTAEDLRQFESRVKHLRPELYRVLGDEAHDAPVSGEGLRRIVLGGLTQ
jgi:hypothetical protein